MEDSQSDENNDPKTFPLDLTPSRMQYLQTILNYATISMDSVEYSQISRSIANDINDVIYSEDFMDAFEEEIRRFNEELENAQMHQPDIQDEFSNKGVQ